MKIKFFSFLMAAGFAALMFSGCSKMPQAEIDSAKAAIDSAKFAGANVYLPEALMELEDSLEAVMVNLESQSSKFIKNYGEVKEQLEKVTVFAHEVQDRTLAVKEEMKAETQAIIAEVNTVIAENKNLVLQAPKGKEGTSALQAIKSEIATIETHVIDAVSLYDNDDIMGAHTKALAAKDKAMSINEELKTVIAKYKGATRK